MQYLRTLDYLCITFFLNTSCDKVLLCIVEQIGTCCKILQLYTDICITTLIKDLFFLDEWLSDMPWTVGLHLCVYSGMCYAKCLFLV